MAGTSGGGIYNFKAQPILNNCILWDNEAPTGPVVINADALVPVITYSCVEGSYAGDGNLDEDPLFVGEIPYGSLQLPAGSPCIDAGTDSGAPDTDLAGRSRPLGGRTDMGAYEFSGMPVSGLSVMPTSLTFHASAGGTTVDIVTPMYWTATSDTAWLHLPAGGVGNTSITVNYEENTGSPRSAMITITGSGTTPGTETVVITQEGEAPVRAKARSRSKGNPFWKVRVKARPLLKGRVKHLLKAKHPLKVKAK